MNNINGEEVKLDRRKRKTRKAIKSALMNLMVEKEISRITIKEISDLADINRKTFYGHYIDFYALLVNATIFDSILNRLKKVLVVKLVSVFIDKTTVNEVMLSYIIDFEVAGLIASYREWFNSDRQVPLEELSKQISLIVSNGVVSIMKELPQGAGEGKVNGDC